MKAILGLVGLGFVCAGVMACPAHIRAEATETVQISDATLDEFARQLDLFTTYMQGETPDLPAAQRGETVTE
ncbi:hypothetical protein [Hyphobacterium marinum]|uniref:Uncharacterized protein n=1 Tax=Hyphobacterium marinum TaxID=3116574 RepID=A0ABU7LUL7_9PROT|nr:hypothetical protein [Hyphobacterium sp. Y6023]MEE2565264.1 hypothetical protein [Hyphobacterium sp. Y6023]